jgi:predicted RNase H-like nuclease
LISANYARKLIAGIRATLPRKDVADDDLYDAFAALWTTERMARGEAVRIPREPPVDAMGLSMEIWY